MVCICMIVPLIAYPVYVETRCRVTLPLDERSSATQRGAPAVPLTHFDSHAGLWDHALVTKTLVMTLVMVMCQV